jgi:hypothetical protein
MRACLKRFEIKLNHSFNSKRTQQQEALSVPPYCCGPTIRRNAFILSLLWALAACAEFPELDAKVEQAARVAPYPKLVPVEEIQARVAPPLITDPSGADVQARVARLKARAAWLRNTKIN